MNNYLSDLIANPLVIQCGKALAAALVVSLIVGFAKSAVSRRIADKDMRYKARKLVSLFGYLLILTSIMVIFSRELSNIAVILGALGVGVGFALKEVIQSLMGWLLVSFWGTYKIGQRVQMGNITGDVIDISPFYTTLMECGAWVKADLYNGRLVRLPNSLVFAAPIINYTADFPFVWDEVVIPIRTVTDHRLARRIIEETANEELGSISEESKAEWAEFVRLYRVEDANLDPMIAMTFDSNYIEFTLRYVVNYRFRRSTKDKLFTSILTRIEATQGKVQIGSTTVEFTDIGPLSVKVSKL